MKEFEQRLVEEKFELTVKVKKLQDFTHTDAFKNLADEHRVLLNKQVNAMYNYIDVLAQRIALLVT
jgi:uncharacterized protein